MKKEYLTLKVRVVELEKIDILTTSGKDYEKDPFEVEGMQVYFHE